MTIETQTVTPGTNPVDSVNDALPPEQGNPVAPEGGDQPEQLQQPERKELTQAEKEAYALKRRVTRLTREKYQYEAELAQLRQSSQPRPSAEETPGASAQPLTPEALRAQAREVVALERLNARCDEVAAKGEKAFPDFAEKVKELSAELPIIDRQGRPTPTMEAILDSDDPARLSHYLGSNPEVAAELADLNPRQQARRLALIERDMDAQPERKPSSAPTPLTPVKPGAASAAPDPSKDVEGYIAYRRKQRAGK